MTLENAIDLIKQEYEKAIHSPMLCIKFGKRQTEKPLLSQRRKVVI